jgi:uncharacterized damage-inducible protein DinB
MAEDRDQLLHHYRQMRLEMLSVIEGLSDEVMTERSLDGWSVCDHLAHIATWDDLRADEVERISAGHASAWRATEEQSVAYNDLAFALRQGMSADQVRWEVARSTKRLLDAISSASPRGLDASLYGDAALKSTHEAAHAEWIRRWRAERGI